ncbi:MAG TPA: Atxe2 family lasso peptide isopeptidase [Candidatus Binatia bacterium]
MNESLCRLILTLLVSSPLLFPVHAQDSGGVPSFDSSALEIKPVAKTTRRPISSKDLLTIRDITGVQISPDGKSVAYVVSQAALESNSYRTALFVVGTEPGSVPVNLGSAGPPHWSSVGQYLRIPPQWSPESRYIAYLVREGNRRQIWLWNSLGGKPERLTHIANDVENYEWQPDGRRIIFTTVEPISPEEIKSVSEQGILYDSYAKGVEGSIQAWKGRSVARAVVEAKPRKKQVWIYQLATRTERKATADEEAAYNKLHLSPKTLEPGDKTFIHTIKPSPDGKSIAYHSQLIDAEKFPRYAWTIFIKRIDEKNYVELVPPMTNFILDLWWSNDGTEIYFTRSTDDGGIALYAVPARGGAEREITKSNDLLLQVSFDKNMSRVACVRENALTPPEVSLIDIKNGVQRTLANVNPEFQNIALSPATKREWVNKYGDKTFGYLVKPLNYEPGKRYPLIVTTYRAYGFLRGAVGDEYPIQVFAANGFAVLAFDDSAERVPKPGDFKTTMLRWYSPMASLEKAIVMLDEMGIINANRKGITGLSFGAELTNFKITHSDIFQAAATSSTGGSRDPLFYYMADSWWRGMFKEWSLNGLPHGDAAPKWQELSPALNAGRVKAPVLIQVAESEYLICLQFFASMKELNKPLEMIIFADEAHIKNQPKHRYEIYQRNLDWFNFWLQDKEDPDPSKKEQYTRWHELRKLQEANSKTANGP